MNPILILYGLFYPASSNESCIFEGDGEELCVILHGFKANSRIFINQADQIAKTRNYKTLYRPILKYHHNGHVKQSGKEVIDFVAKWAERYPTNPIVIIGISMGGVLAMNIDQKLREINLSGREVNIITVGSPLYGTEWGSMFPNIVKWIGGEEFLEHMDPDYRQIKIFIDECPVNHIYHHIYSSVDWMVFPPKNCILFNNNILHVSCPHNLLQTEPAVLNFIKKIGK